MPSCVLRYCTNSSRNASKCQGITFHRFPRAENSKDSEKWIKFVRKNRSEKDWLPTEYTHICSSHFREEDKYTSKSGRIYLKKTAVPCVDTESTKQKTGPRKKLSVYLQNEREIMLKKIIIKQKDARKKLAYKLKKVQRENRTLRKKCQTYKEVVEMLRKKYNIDSQSDDMQVKEDID